MMPRRLVMTGAALFVAALGNAAAAVDEPVISVRETGGAYTVSARFTVAAPAALVRDVLTDYENIPRFMPEVRRSLVLERGPGHARVEQEAVSSYMMFSKRVYLVLDVEEGPGVIRFRDACNRSFAQYEGSWTFTVLGDVTEVSYELTAQPTFSVPGFVLRRLLNRDAGVTIDRLRTEISARARQ